LPFNLKKPYQTNTSDWLVLNRPSVAGFEPPGDTWMMVIPVSVLLGFVAGWLVKVLWGSQDSALTVFALTFGISTFWIIVLLDRISIKQSK
jgi:hypothetical protein